MSEGGDYVIEIEGLWTRYGEFVVHRGVDLKVKSGEILALVGGRAPARPRCCARCWAWKHRSRAR